MYNPRVLRQLHDMIRRYENKYSEAVVVLGDFNLYNLWKTLSKLHQFVNFPTTEIALWITVTVTQGLYINLSPTSLNEGTNYID